MIRSCCQSEAAGVKCFTHFSRSAFTLVEMLVASVIFTLTIAGLIYGYVQANHMAEWSCMSLAAQSCASQGAEQARAAVWIPTQKYSQLGSMPYTHTTTNILDVPIKGDPTTNTDFYVINNVTVDDVKDTSVYLRQITSDAIWTFQATGKKYTNTVILLRAPDQ